MEMDRVTVVGQRTVSWRELCVFHVTYGSNNTATQTEFQNERLYPRHIYFCYTGSNLPCLDCHFIARYKVMTWPQAVVAVAVAFSIAAMIIAIAKYH